MWINRDIANKIEADNSVVQVLIGPRQTGKTSLLHHLNQEYLEISFDDPTIRQLAAQDPLMFLDQYGEKKLLIDEAHLVPEIFFALKRKVDLFKRNNKKIFNRYRLTGSNQILIDKNVKESLAGRASYFKLNTLSVSEILAAVYNPIFEIIYKGGWPEIYSQNLNPKSYLDNYINTYIEKDIVLSTGITRTNDFMRLCKLLASRIGQLLNYSELSKEIGVEPNTIKSWVSALERMGIIYLVEPYATNISKRIIKSPKIYFLDTGLAARFQGWGNYTQIIGSPYSGFLFENLVFAELYKLILNFDINANIYHWRTRDNEEVDFVFTVEKNKTFIIESKISAQSPRPLDSYKELAKVFDRDKAKLLVCHADGEHTFDQRVPIKKLKSYIIQNHGPTVS